jgi:outer membrane protein insertion porin family
MRDILRAGVTLASTILVLTLHPVPALGQADRFLGRPIADVRLTIQGQPTGEAELRDVLETRAGEPLAMAQVRESIIHLMALGRFENVQVNAEQTPKGMLLTYDMVPLRTVRAIEFTGRLVLARDLLRSEVVDRYGSQPPLGRGDDIAQTLEDLYRDHGFLDPHVRCHVVNQVRRGRATLVFEVDAGSQARVGRIHFEGSGGLTEADVLRRLQVKAGSPYDRSDVARRASAYADSLRAKDFYAARIDVTPRPSADNATVDLDVTADRGPRVSIDLEGDPVPAASRAQLVPVASEKSIDEDLLEDWSKNIEGYFQGQGYRDAKAPFAREDSGDGQLLRIVYTVRHGPRYVIESVAVAGARFFDGAALVAQLGMQPGQPLVQRALDAGVAKILVRYQREGFMAVSAKPELATHVSTGTEVRQAVTVQVAEGPRTLVGSVTFVCNGSGPCAVPEAVLRNALNKPREAGAKPREGDVTLEPGVPFYLPDLEKARDAVLLAYLNRGYQLATVAIRPPDKMMTADRSRADVRFDIQEGPQVVVDHILLVGNNRTRTSTIWNELQLRPGDPLDLDKLAESQRRLTALGLFRRVRVSELQHGSEARRDVVVSVEEAPSTSMAYGGGIEGAKRLREVNGAAVPAIELAPRVLFDIGRRNLFGKNRSINFTSSAAVRPNAQTTNLVGTGLWEYRALATYREPRIFRTAADLFVTGGVEQTVRTSYTFNRRSVRAELARRLSPTLTLFGRYSLERTHILSEQASVEEQVLIDRLLPPYLLSKVSAVLVRDTRDDSIDPTTGMLASIESDLVPRVLGSEVGFAKTLGQLFVYQKLPTARRIVFAGGARLGLAAGFLGPIGTSGTVARIVPISERFFSGNSVRGFIEDRLGTPDTLTPEGFPTGGNAVLILNGELRFSVWKDFAAVTFVDAGNVFGRVSELAPTEIRPALGFGLRYKSPVGPIRVDLGFNPFRRTFGGTREPLTAIYFGIGQAF